MLCTIYLNPNIDTNDPNEPFTAIISSISPIRIGSLFKYKYVTH